MYMFQFHVFTIDEDSPKQKKNEIATSEISTVIMGVTVSLYQVAFNC